MVGGTELEYCQKKRFHIPEAFLLTLVKGIIRMRSIELRTFISERRHRKENKKGTFLFDEKWLSLPRGQFFHFQEDALNFTDHRLTNQRNVLFTYIYRDWVLFQRGSKSKSPLRFNAVTLLWNLVSFLRLDDFFPQPKGTCFLLLNKIVRYVNSRATAIVGT